MRRARTKRKPSNPPYDPILKLELAATADGWLWVDSLAAIRILRNCSKVRGRLRSEKAHARQWLKRHLHLLRDTS